MPLLGISIKLWCSDYCSTKNEFLTTDSVVYVFHDRSQEEMSDMSMIVKKLTGDESLDQIFAESMPSVKGKVVTASSTKMNSTASFGQFFWHFF